MFFITAQIRSLNRQPTIFLREAITLARVFCFFLHCTMFHYSGVNRLHNAVMVEAALSTFAMVELNIHKVEARRITRLTLEAIEIAFYLCNLHLERYGLVKIYDVVNQILPTAYVVNTSYWPFYTNQFDQCICVCTRYGLRCPHRLNISQHWINMTPLKEDSAVYFSSPEQCRLHPVSATVSVTPVVYEVIKAYDLNIDMLVRQIEVEDDQFVFRDAHTARLSIGVRYLITPEHIKPPDTKIQFRPSPSSIAAYASYFYNLPMSQRMLGSFGRDTQVPRNHTIVPCEIPRFTHVRNNPDRPTRPSYIQSLCQLILTPQVRRAPSQAFTHALIGRTLAYSSTRPNDGRGQVTIAGLIRRDLAPTQEYLEAGPSTSSHHVGKLGQRSNGRDRPRGVTYRHQRPPKARRPENSFALVLPVVSSAETPRSVPRGETGETLGARNRVGLEVVAEEIVDMLGDGYETAFPELGQTQRNGNSQPSIQEEQAKVEFGNGGASASVGRVPWHIPEATVVNARRLWEEPATTSRTDDVIVIDDEDTAEYLDLVSEVIDLDIQKEKA